MATQTRGLIRDQNLNVHFDAAPFGVKSNVLKAQKNGGLSGRKVHFTIYLSRGSLPHFRHQRSTTQRM
ncbi:hypothetical protein LOK49_LG07G00391 [Camellia lanceoleosa]|uniref:Uncharacterized protein n=1 Tax=Camellia lanceoleosa TaxID=1840588 RepID=A0ACC0GZ32_9ERIC|nr:hypothetical protein LOK49_LG07G00391 [Camellia lanceoleosa]